MLSKGSIEAREGATVNCDPCYREEDRARRKKSVIASTTWGVRPLVVVLAIGQLSVHRLLGL